MLLSKLYLSELKVGDEATVIGFIDEDIPTKLYEIGIIPGIMIKVFRKAPFNGPICFSIGKDENKMALRKKEAYYVLVDKKE